MHNSRSPAVIAANTSNNIMMAWQRCAGYINGDFTSMANAHARAGGIRAPSARAHSPSVCVRVTVDARGPKSVVTLC